jgi:adenylate cyclase
VLGLLLFSVGGFMVWNSYKRQATVSVEAASLDKMAYPLPEKPSIAVLPFKNFSGDEKDGLIAKGLTEDIITTLSRVPELFVIASASSANYEGKTVEISQVSEDLGVRYILDGSVQRSKDRLRFNVQLVDAIAGTQIWADRFDRKVEDLFVLQDELVRRILVELQVKLTAGEFARIASRKTQNLDAWILFGQGFHEGFNYTREGMVRARELFESAREKDPDWARPLVGLSWVYWNEARYRWTDDPDEWMRKGFELAEKAVELEPEEPGGYQMLGMLNLSKGDYNSAIAFREHALKLAPNDFVVVWGLGYVLYNAGDAQRGVDFLKKAERMSPHHPVLLLWAISEVQLMAGQYEDTIETSKRAVALKTGRVIPHIILTAANSALDRFEETKNEAAEVLKINPNFTVSGWMKSRLLKDPADTERYANLLIMAGLPEK